MLTHPPGPPEPAFPPPLPALSPDALSGLLLAALLAAVALAILRASLLHSHAARVLARARTPRARKRLEPLLERIDPLLSSARLLEILAQTLFVALLLAWLGRDQGLRTGTLLLTVVVAVPALLVIRTVLPDVVARRHGDGLLLAVLPTFHALSTPLRPLVAALDALRQGLQRAFGVPASDASTREIVAGLRDAIEDAGRSGGLDEVERELIENVMEFRDVDVAAVMTPRTEIDGVDVAAGMRAAARLASERGHSRLPVYRGSLDDIVGTISAREMIGALAEGGAEEPSLEDHLRPAFFVPETKRVSELVHEFRRERQKMAIVLDEYGGTAGIVTLGDALSEIVGELHEVPDAGEEEAEPVRRLEPGVALVDAGTHVTDVNEELGLDIPEAEDYETLAGFVLSELGHFPKGGESFRRKGVEFKVTEASDRRVLRVRVERLETQPSS